MQSIDVDRIQATKYLVRICQPRPMKKCDAARFHLIATPLRSEPSPAPRRRHLTIRHRSQMLHPRCRPDGTSSVVQRQGLAGQNLLCGHRPRRLWNLSARTQPKRMRTKHGLPPYLHIGNTCTVARWKIVFLDEGVAMFHYLHPMLTTRIPKTYTWRGVIVSRRRAYKRLACRSRPLSRLALQ